jgi:hypothetical protein
VRPIVSRKSIYQIFDVEVVAAPVAAASGFMPSVIRWRLCSPRARGWRSRSGSSGTPTLPQRWATTDISWGTIIATPLRRSKGCCLGRSRKVYETPEASRIDSITFEVPVIHPESMPNAEITSYKPTCRGLGIASFPFQT